MKQYLEHIADKFGLFIIGGLIGAIIHRVRNKMPLLNFFATLITSAFVGVIVGILLRNYLKLNEEVTFACVSTAGVFSKDFLDIISDIIKQIKKTVQYLSIVIKKLFEKKANINLDN